MGKPKVEVRYLTSESIFFPLQYLIKITDEKVLHSSEAYTKIFTGNFYFIPPPNVKETEIYIKNPFLLAFGRGESFGYRCDVAPVGGPHFSGMPQIQDYMDRTNWT